MVLSQVQSSWGMKLTTHLHLVSEVIYIYSPYMPSCHAQGLTVLQKLTLLTKDNLDNVNYIHSQMNKTQL